MTKQENSTMNKIKTIELLKKGKKMTDKALLTDINNGHDTCIRYASKSQLDHLVGAGLIDVRLSEIWRKYDDVRQRVLEEGKDTTRTRKSVLIYSTATVTTVIAWVFMAMVILDVTMSGWTHALAAIGMVIVSVCGVLASDTLIDLIRGE